MVEKSDGPGWERYAPRRRRPLRTVTERAVIVYVTGGSTYVRSVSTPPPLVELIGEADGATLLIAGGRMPTAAEIERAISAGDMKRAVDVRWHLAPPGWFGSRDCFGELETVSFRRPARPPLRSSSNSRASRRGRGLPERFRR